MKIKFSFLAKITFIFFALFVLSSRFVLAQFNYTPMEKIPGFEGISGSFPEYILSVYRFGIWTIGIAAMLMIMIGGYMYITSAGNTASMGKAKGIITDAIIGLLLAFTAWLILYTINPELVKIKSIQMNTGAAGVPGTKGGPGGTSDGGKAACPDPTSTTPINYANAINDTGIKPNDECNKYNFSNSSGVDPAMLKAIAQMESSCGKNKGPSGSGACGLMQLLPSTASSLAGKNVTCEELKSNDQLSIDLASKFIQKHQGDSCVTAANNPTAAIFGGYNSGYGCGNAACNSKKHALCSSSDCSGALAFECCVNPGGLSESINYAWNGMGLYEKFK